MNKLLLLVALIFSTSLMAATCSYDLIQKSRIEVMTTEQTADVCREIVAIINENPSPYLLKQTSIASYMLNKEGYGDNFTGVAKDLLLISKYRGQLGDGDKAITNNYNIAYKMYTAWNHDVTPKSIIDFLRSSGPAGRSLSDDGLVQTMASQR
ncbi:hypothetical protein V7I42_00255 [Raoultella ornithinolytica]|uniref:hypothetical protein n=1 Tax=Raoultella ornithinolytica TaxID=54291 RepID=UPI002FF0721C